VDHSAGGGRAQTLPSEIRQAPRETV